ncbi:MAG: pyridoxamine 5'-phosphate oxidase family protein [Leptospirillia bacterium]
MGKQYDRISERHKAFIAGQHIFFVATAANGRVNLSPKGLDSLRVVGDNRVLWLNLTGSGNETAAHLLQNDRMTLMFCAFSGDPLILRLYGTARAVHPGDGQWEALAAHFPDIPGARQVLDMHVDLVQTSCGFGVPEMDFKQNRQVLTDWAEKKGDAGVRAYWAEHNRSSLDGNPTGIPTEEP